MHCRRRTLRSLHAALHCMHPLGVHACMRCACPCRLPFDVHRIRAAFKQVEQCMQSDRVRPLIMLLCRGHALLSEGAAMGVMARSKSMGEPMVKAGAGREGGQGGGTAQSSAHGGPRMGCRLPPPGARTRTGRAAQQLRCSTVLLGSPFLGQPRNVPVVPAVWMAMPATARNCCAAPYRASRHRCAGCACRLQGQEGCAQSGRRHHAQCSGAGRLQHGKGGQGS